MNFLNLLTLKDNPFFELICYDLEVYSKLYILCKDINYKLNNTHIDFLYESEVVNGTTNYYYKKKLHRDNDLPAIIYENGDKEWWICGVLHRDNDLPAVERSNGDKEWWIYGKLHRDNDLPAKKLYILEEWYQHGKIHRNGDLPALIYKDGTKMWYKFGKLHRDNGLPARKYIGGTKEWWENGDFLRTAMY